jgi:hypothetical protein
LGAVQTKWVVSRPTEGFSFAPISTRHDRSCASNSGGSIGPKRICRPVRLLRVSSDPCRNSLHGVSPHADLIGGVRPSCRFAVCQLADRGPLLTGPAGTSIPLQPAIRPSSTPSSPSFRNLQRPEVGAADRNLVPLEHNTRLRDAAHFEGGRSRRRGEGAEYGVLQICKGALRCELGLEVARDGDGQNGARPQRWCVG